ncbi:MAG: hypothetical protein F4Y35_01180 [Chloroflexi bacterium]|nr:hypothetical protein [Chloroflexota bacterium]
MAKTRNRSNRPNPPVPLESALRVAQAIVNGNGGHPMHRLLLAEAMEQRPGSSLFRDRITASSKYGLTVGNYNSESIALTELGNKATRPRNEQEQVDALREAVRSVEIYSALLDHFANARLPDRRFMQNTLELPPFNVDPGWSGPVISAFVADAEYVRFLRSIGGSPHIVVEGSTAIPEPLPTTEPIDPDVDPIRPESNPDLGIAQGMDADRGDALTERPVPMQLFLSHGEDQSPLEELRGILEEWHVPYLVGDEPGTEGLPLSEGVAMTMRECSAAIFVVTEDEVVARQGTGIVTRRPSVHIDYQLGAASLLYGQKIVILKQAGATFERNLSALRVIEFKEDGVRAVALDLLRELIEIGALRLVSASGG